MGRKGAVRRNRRMEPGSHCRIPFAEKCPVDFQPSSRLSPRWHMGALHLHHSKGDECPIKATGPRRWRACHSYVWGRIHSQRCLTIQETLRPLHQINLLLLQSGTTLPPGAFRKEDVYSRRRWRQVQYLSDVFLRRWLKQYDPSLQDRQRWTRSANNFEVGDIVVVEDENSPRNSWPLGRIQEVRPNKGDRLVRRVILMTKTSILERPINKIVLLEGPRLHESSWKLRTVSMSLAEKFVYDVKGNNSLIFLTFSWFEWTDIN